jgi:hypothetical protein
METLPVDPQKYNAPATERNSSMGKIFETIESVRSYLNELSLDYSEITTEGGLRVVKVLFKQYENIETFLTLGFKVKLWFVTTETKKNEESEETEEIGQYLMKPCHINPFTEIEEIDRFGEKVKSQENLQAYIQVEDKKIIAIRADAMFTDIDYVMEKIKMLGYYVKGERAERRNVCRMTEEEKRDVQKITEEERTEWQYQEIEAIVQGITDEKEFVTIIKMKEEEAKIWRSDDTPYAISKIRVKQTEAQRFWAPKIIQALDGRDIIVDRYISVEELLSKKVLVRAWFSAETKKYSFKAERIKSAEKRYMEIHINDTQEFTERELYHMGYKLNHIDSNLMIIEKITEEDTSTEEPAEKITCKECGKEIEEDENIYEVEGIPYCDECATTCEECNKTVRRDEMFLIRKQGSTGYPQELYVCEECYNEEVIGECESCGETLFRTDYNVQIQGDGIVCRDCYMENYATCEECEQIVHRDSIIFHNDRYLCESCYEEGRSSLISSYHEKKATTKMKTEEENEEGKDVLLFGMEIEIENKSRHEDTEALAEICMDSIGETYEGEDKIWLSSDGSLSDGFEIITQPFSMNYWKETFKEEIAGMCKEMIRAGARSHETSTCGLHVHMSKLELARHKEIGFTELRKEMLVITRNIWEDMLKLSRRKLSEVTQYAKPVVVKIKEDKARDKKERNQKVEEAIYDLNNERYSAINFTNRQTVEIRIFKGTLNPETIEATLQVCDAIAAVTQHHDDIFEIKSLSVLVNVAERIRGERYDTLREYAEKRGVIIKENTQQLTPEEERITNQQEFKDYVEQCVVAEI